MVLNEEQKELLIKNFKTRLTKDQVLLMQSDESRSQHKNKTIIISRFLELIKTGLIVPKRRRKTRIPKSVRLKRLSNKKQNAEKKANRKPPKID